MVHHKRLNALRQRLARPDNRFRSSRDFVHGDEAAFERDTESPPLSPDVFLDSLPDPTLSPDPPLTVLPSRTASLSHPQSAPSSDQSILTPITTDEKISNQLLQKIAELEKANKELIASQLDIKSRLDHLSIAKASDDIDSPVEVISEEYNLPQQLGHRRSSSGIMPNHDAGKSRVRRRREGSSGPSQIRLQGASAPSTPFFMDFPQSHSEVTPSLLDELDDTEDATGAYLLAPPDRSPSENSDDRQPTLPGAFVSPIKPPAHLGNHYRRPRAHSSADLRPQELFLDSREDVDSEDPENSEARALQAYRATDGHLRTATQRSSFSLFVQIWVYLQFCIVIVVFMFSVGNVGRPIPARRRK